MAKNWDLLPKHVDPATPAADWPPTCNPLAVALKRVLLLFLLAVTIGCQTRKAPVVALDDGLATDLAALRQKRVFFSHQSVGDDILNGVRDLTQGQGAGLMETRVGRNQDPAGKFEDFARQLERTRGAVDVAAMKLCYIDFDSRTDAAALFRHYEKTIQVLRIRYPHIAFVHVTVPLTAMPRTLRTFVKVAIGREDENTSANLRRSEFNELMRIHYRGEPLFDLAGVESTYADGSREKIQWRGQSGYSLIAEYSSDGGHLNSTGRRLAAREFLRVLASAHPPQRT